jgi:hypothetical protein
MTLKIIRICSSVLFRRRNTVPLAAATTKLAIIDSDQPVPPGRSCQALSNSSTQ